MKKKVLVYTLGIVLGLLSLTRADVTKLTYAASTPVATSFLAADFTNSTATLASTALSVNVVVGRRYVLRAAVFSTDSVAAEGSTFAFDGGTATATNYRMHCRLHDAGLLQSIQRTTLAGAWGVATQTGAAVLDCQGALEPSASGSVILRAAQNSHTSGTLTVHRGSWLVAEEVP